MKDLHVFLDLLRRENELATVEAEADPRLEIPEIHRRVIEARGKALLFKRPKGADFPVVTNLFGTQKRLELAFGRKPREFVETAARAAIELLPPTGEKLWAFRSFLGAALRVGTQRAAVAPVRDVVDDAPDLTRLPALTQWPEDAGAFLTLPLVYSELPSDGRAGRPQGRQSNLGVYRMQIHGPRTAGVHWQIAKGGGFHYHEAEARGSALPLTVFLGGPPALILAAVAPLPEGLSELLVASLLLGRKLPMTSVPSHPHRLVADAEFALVGFVPPKVRKPEGPFGDHYGYYSLAHDYPVFEVARIYRRHNAIFPATVVGKPRQEDFYIGDLLQELLSPMFPLVMPTVVDLWSYGDTGFHSLAAAVVKDRYGREAMTSAFRILGEGQLALTKFLLVTDAKRDLRDFRGLLGHVLARCRFETDLFVFSNLAMDTLDYTGPKVNEGSKGVLLGLGNAIRELPREFHGALPQGARSAAVFCPGALVVDGPSFDSDRSFAERLARDSAVAGWPLVVLADDAEAAARDERAFLWHVFTRFEPAADIHARHDVVRNHIAFTPPAVLDARTKPWMPKVVEVDPGTAALVDRRWR
ncbi:MAG TPA: UbiD family decarboxylase, partial [Thermoanaerobaculia bacterium]|nr:UbiD family decarboxylase [Thermoanaerobaculia bacterium]